MAIDDAEQENKDPSRTSDSFKWLRMTVAGLVPEYDKELRNWVETYPDKWVQLGSARTKYFRSRGQIESWFDRPGWDFLTYTEANPSLHFRSNAPVVKQVRSILTSTGEERAPRRMAYPLTSWN